MTTSGRGETKCAAAAAFFTRAFRDKTTRKIYWAIVAGLPKLRQGKIDLALTKGVGEGRERVRADDDGKDAVTYYTVVDSAGDRASWLALLPLTGRTHQLRAHMDHIGHPIVGDPKYFARENWELPGGMQNKLHLLARRIVVPHPRGGIIDATAPLAIPRSSAVWPPLTSEIATVEFEPEGVICRASCGTPLTIPTVSVPGGKAF